MNDALARWMEFLPRSAEGSAGKLPDRGMAGSGAASERANERENQRATEHATERAAERQLLLRVRDDDALAFGALVERHLARVTQLAAYMLGSHDRAEDVVQMVFVQAWEHRRTLDPERPLRPYLLRAVRNRVLDERKADRVRERYREHVRGDAVAGTIRTVVPSPEGAMLTAAMVQDALKRLQHRRQLALRLWVEDELTPAEVADVLGISAQAADRLLRRALADLREILVTFR